MRQIGWITAALLCTGSVAALAELPEATADNSAAVASPMASPDTMRPARPAAARDVSQQADPRIKSDVPGSDLATAQASADESRMSVQARLDATLDSPKALPNIATDVAAAAAGSATGARIGLLDIFNAASINKLSPTIPATRRYCRFAGKACTLGQFRTLRGTALVEVVRSAKPDAEIFLAEAYTLADYRAAIDWFAANNVKVVVHSLTWSLDGPGNGTGPSADVVKYAVSKGILWVNGAGDAGFWKGYTAYDGGYWRGTWSDRDNDGWLAFQGTDESMGVYCGWVLGVRWDDWGTSRTDYDLYISDLDIRRGTTGAQRLASGYNQARGARPLEGGQLFALCNQDPKLGPVWDTNKDGFVNLWVKNTKRTTESPTGDVIEVVVTGWLEHAIGSGSVRLPFSDSASTGMLTVGGGGVSRWGDGKIRATAGSGSGQGPTSDGRVKPDLVSDMCVPTLTYGFCPGPDGTSFLTTDVSAAKAAGFAARQWALYPGATPDRVARFMKDTAARGPIDASRPSEWLALNDNQVGAGVARVARDNSPDLTGHFVPEASPKRILDTRTGLGQHGTKRPLPANSSAILDFEIPGLSPQPNRAVVLSVTSIGARTPGWVEVYPYAGAYPNTSHSLEVDRAGRSVSSLVVATLGADELLSLHQSMTGHVTVDLLGTFHEGGGGFVSTEPYVAYRSDCPGTGCGRLVAGASRHVRVSRPGDVRAQTAGGGGVVLSVTSLAPTAAGQISVVPFGRDPSKTTTVSFAAGESRTATTFVALPPGSDGRIRVMSTAGTHVQVDVLGWFTDGALVGGTRFVGGSFVKRAPWRALDTRRTSPTPPDPTSSVVTVADESRTRGIPMNAGTLLVTTTLSATASSMAARLAGDPSARHINVSATGAGRSVSAATLTNVTDLAIAYRGSARSHRTIDVTGYFVAADQVADRTKFDVLAGVGGAAPDGRAANPVMSPDGDIVVFATSAHNLGPADTNDKWDLYSWKRSTGEVRRHTDGPGGFWATGGPTITPVAVSGDGTKAYVVASSLVNLTPDDTDSWADGYILDLSTNALTPVTGGDLQPVVPIWPASGNSTVSGSLDRIIVTTGGGTTQYAVKDHATDTLHPFPAAMPGNQFVRLTRNGQKVFINVGDTRREWTVGDAASVDTPSAGLIEAVNGDGSKVLLGNIYGLVDGVAAARSALPQRRFCHVYEPGVGMADDGLTVVTTYSLCKPGAAPVPVVSTSTGRVPDSVPFEPVVSLTPDGSTVLASRLPYDVAPVSKDWFYVYDVS